MVSKQSEIRIWVFSLKKARVRGGGGVVCAGLFSTVE